MILKINKIKNLGLFNDYTPIPGLKDFKKYNLIYGWNGSGKTTLSKFFDALVNGSHPDYPDLEFEIQGDSSKRYQQTHPFDRKVRVFNQDYIENNLKIREGKAKSITLILGDASKDVLEEIEKYESELIRKNSELEQEKIKLDNGEKTKGRTFTEIAKTIYVAIVGGATRNYRKDNAEVDFALLKAKSILTNGDLEKLSVTVKQFQKPLIDPLKEIELEFADKKEKVRLNKAIADLLKETKSVVEKQVEQVIIERLRDNQDISDWVEIGLKIQDKHSNQNCEFCGQKIPHTRIQELAKHFNEADRLLKIDIDNLVTKIMLVKEAVRLSEAVPDIARFYEDLSGDYKKVEKVFLGEVSNLLLDLEKVKVTLVNKKSKTTEFTKFETVIDTDKFINGFASVNALIVAHNKKTADFETSKKEAIQKIKDHYLSTIFDEIGSLQKEIDTSKNKIAVLNCGDPLVAGDMGILKLRQSIADNRAKISSTHKACADITKNLNTFLGRQELVFEPNKIKTKDTSGNQVELEDGYIIKRNGKAVNHLSEGEKTAIAFVYFIIHLNDSSFNKNKDIVVIDDPVSSLDSNSIFQAFSFLRNAVKDTKQVFIFTHNYDFLRLVLNWLTHNSVKKNSCFYMIKNKDTSTERTALLDELDKNLQDFESEYNYLFSILQDFKTDGTIASVYHIPNISRKVLETFLMFRVPNNDNLHEKLEYLKPLFDEMKITAIYKFTNSQSHLTGKGFDPSLIPETQKVVKYLLEFIETTFPDHYKILMKQ